jgi:hypothetical protein
MGLWIPAAGLRSGLRWGRCCALRSASALRAVAVLWAVRCAAAACAFVCALVARAHRVRRARGRAARPPGGLARMAVAGLQAPAAHPNARWMLATRHAPGVRGAWCACVPVPVTRHTAKSNLSLSNALYHIYGTLHTVTIDTVFHLV